MKLKNNDDMNELYYSKPNKNMKNENFYGTSGNYVIHKDAPFKFNGIRFYRVLIGLKENNKSVITNFVNAGLRHKINKGDYVVFDFDRTTHEVIKDKSDNTQRTMLKLHFIVCEDCKWPSIYVEMCKKIYLYYEFITRYVMESGKDPETFIQFFFGLMSSTLYLQYLYFYLLIIFIVILTVINKVFKIKFKYKNVLKFVKYTLLLLFIGYSMFVLFFWLRFQLFNIK